MYAQGLRAVYGDHPRMRMDPHFRSHLQFFEYFHGDSGRGVGASHQTGWTGLIAKLLMSRYRQLPCDEHLRKVNRRAAGINF